MNRLEFLAKMRNTLEKGGLPEDDIKDALSYYEEVFLDAEEGNGAETMGDPESIARDILMEAGIHADGDAQLPPEEIKPESYSSGSTGTAHYSESSAPKKSGSNMLLKLILIVLTFPIWMPVLIVVVVLLFVVIVVVLALVFSFLAAGIAALLGGIRLLFEAPFSGMMMAGGGLVITGLFVLIAGPVLKKFVPATINIFRNIIDRIGDEFRNGGRKNG